MSSSIKNKLSLTLISFLANFIVAGFSGQFGMLTEPMAQFYHSNVNTVASIFSLLNAGSLIGTIAAFFLIEKIGVKRITSCCYVVVFLFAVLMHFSTQLYQVEIAISLIGFCGGIGLCLAGTIIVSVWEGNKQSSMFIIQDATFNIAGVIFPLVTTFVLTYHFRWSYSYLVVGLFALVVIAMAQFTDFSPCETNKGSDSQQAAKSEWNIGVIGGGIGLFLGMLALYTFLTWAPLFVSHKFNISFVDAGTVITKYWTAALIGALLSSVIVTKIRIHYFLIIIIACATVITAYIVNTHDLKQLGLLTYTYGFVCAGLYNSFVAYGVSFLKQPSSKNVSYILISGSAGAMFSPAISSVVEKFVGLQVVMGVIPFLYGIILLLLISALFIKLAK